MIKGSLEKIIKSSIAITAGLIFSSAISQKIYSDGWNWKNHTVEKNKKKIEKKSEDGNASKNGKDIEFLDAKENIKLNKIIEDYGGRSEIKYNLIAPVNSWYGTMRECKNKYEGDRLAALFGGKSDDENKYVWETPSQPSPGYIIESISKNVQHGPIMDSSDGIEQVFIVPHLLQINKKGKKELDIYVFVDKDFYNNNREKKICLNCSRNNTIIKFNGKNINGIYVHHLKLAYDADKKMVLVIAGDHAPGIDPKNVGIKER